MMHHLWMWICLMQFLRSTTSATWTWQALGSIPVFLKQREVRKIGTDKVESFVEFSGNRADKVRVFPVSLVSCHRDVSSMANCSMRLKHVCGLHAVAGSTFGLRDVSSMAKCSIWLKHLYDFHAVTGSTFDPWHWIWLLKAMPPRKRTSREFAEGSSTKKIKSGKPDPEKLQNMPHVGRLSEWLLSFNGR